MRAVFIALFFSLLCGRAGAHFTEPRLLGKVVRSFTQATQPGDAGGFNYQRIGLKEETQSRVLWAGWLPVMEERTRTVSGEITGVTTRRWFQWGADLSGTLDGAGGIGGLVGIIEEDGAGVVTRTLLPVQDGLGNITAVIDQATGRTVARYDYGPFGEALSESGEVDACPFRWQTKWYDAESQHYYFGYRHYDPRFGRWLSRDPLGEAGGFNLYAYCGNDPVNRHDPLGLWWWDGDNIEYGILPLFGFTKGDQTVGDAWSAFGEGYHQGAVNVVAAPYRLGNYAGEQGIAAYDLGKETGSSDFEALRLATGVTVTRVTGALDLIEATVGGQKIVGDSDSGLGMQDFSSGWERTLHGVAGGLQLVGTATTFAGGVTRFSSAPRVPGSPPINAVNPELANRLAAFKAAKGGGSLTRLRNWWNIGSEADGAWRALPLKDKAFYEIGQKTLPGKTFENYAVLDPVARGRALVNDQGWGHAIWPQGTGYKLGFGTTLTTGPTPLVRWAVPRAAGAGAAAEAGYYFLGSED